jgi:hypothetical protein
MTSNNPVSNAWKIVAVILAIGSVVTAITITILYSARMEQEVDGLTVPASGLPVGPTGTNDFSTISESPPSQERWSIPDLAWTGWLSFQTGDQFRVNTLGDIFHCCDGHDQPYRVGNVVTIINKTESVMLIQYYFPDNYDTKYWKDLAYERATPYLQEGWYIISDTQMGDYYIGEKDCGDLVCFHEICVMHGATGSTTCHGQYRSSPYGNLWEIRMAKTEHSKESSP